jgi:hypothetical protein
LPLRPLDTLVIFLARMVSSRSMAVSMVFLLPPVLVLTAYTDAGV